ncbi:hypothetical protein F4859DRAFT_279079 [Xylaria cf. heliscus]|nr:hypothetical protein F4859DRAFT_279079 [Xylaria cf. heliscus]
MAHQHPPPPPPPGGISGSNDSVVCVICGGICRVTPVFGNEFIRTPPTTPIWMHPMLVQAKPGFKEWQEQNLHTSSRRQGYESTDQIETVQVTRFIGGSQGMMRGTERLPINTMDPLMKIPIHPTCFYIARIFCRNQVRFNFDFRCPSGGRPSTIAQLYEIWCNRAIATCPTGLMTRPIREPHSYLGAPVYNTIPQYFHAISQDPSLQRFLAFPVEIPGLTDLVVNANLQMIPSTQRDGPDEHTGLFSRIQRLPQELVDRIIECLEPFEEDKGPSLQVTRILPPRVWKQILFSGHLIPWLWDLDNEEVTRYRIREFYHSNIGAAIGDQEKGANVFNEDLWDWELLCRQLAQFNVLEAGGILNGRSMKLWNRRRIWKLLDAARLGHMPFS